VKGLNRSHLLAAPQVFEDLDFDAPAAPEFRRDARFHIERDGKLAGFLVWLTLDTGAGEGIDILENEHCWLPIFFPVFHPALMVSVGDRIDAISSAALCENGRNPDYFIEGAVHRRAQEPHVFRHDSFHHARVFRASPFYDDFFRGDAVPLATSEAGTAEAPIFDSADLRQRLEQRLPKHMVPSTFLQLDSLPLMASGKLDRRALLALAAVTSGEDSREMTPPRSRTEIAIARIWQEILKLRVVGLQTNFFDQGGHSLLLLQVQDRIKDELGAEIPVTDLFKYPTVETLAQRLVQRSDPAKADADHDIDSHRRAAARQAALRHIGDRRRAQSAVNQDLQ